MRKKTRIISFSGKGGSGKTTTASLFLSSIIKTGKFEQILVIDADPDANLATTLNVAVENTVGKIADKRKRDMDGNELGERIRNALWNTIFHGEQFDLLVMGRSTGEGCYCSINSILNSILDETINLYDLVIIDFDAGLEHFARRTCRPNDTLIVTCDPSRLSFDTAQRISDIVTELSLPYTHQYLIGCRYAEEQKDRFNALASKTGFDVLGIVPYDQEIASLNLNGKPLIDLDENSVSLQYVKGMVNKVLEETELSVRI